MKRYFYLIVLALIFSCNLVQAQVYSSDQAFDGFIRKYLKDAGLDSTSQVAKAKVFTENAAGSLVLSPTLFNDIDLSAYELLSASFNFSDDKTTQKIVVAPFRLLEVKYNEANRSRKNVLSNMKGNLSHRSGIVTIGLGAGYDSSSPYSKKSQRQLKEVYRNFPTPDPIPDTLKSNFIIYEKTSLADYQKRLDSLLIAYDELRLKNVHKFTLGYSVQLFPIILGKGNVDNYDSLNHESESSHVFSGSYSYFRNSYNAGIQVSFNLLWARASPAHGQKLQPYYGPAIAYKKRLIKFASISQLRSEPAYTSSHFIPSLYFGLSFEGRYFAGKAQDKEYVIDKIEQLDTYTLFFDFAISKASQLRFAVPWTKQKFVDNKSTACLGTAIQYNFIISNLN